MIVPVLIIVNPDKNDQSFYYIITFSIYIRVTNSAWVMIKYHRLGHTDVDRQINILLLTMVLLMYISSGMYSVVERDLNN